MIKNFIFDFGNVLTQYDPIAWATNIMGGDREKGAYLHDKTIYNKKFWDDYDAGLCSEEEIIERLSCDIEPEYRNAVKEFTTTVERCFKQYDEMVPVLNELKKRGCRTYLLSNFPKEMFIRVSSRCPILKLLDDTVVSYKIHLIKPHREIFEYVLNTYGLQAQETLFADDMEVNTKAAQELGIHGYTFTTAQKFTEHLKELGVF